MNNDAERAEAFKACPDTGCDWGAFLRGFQAGAAYQRAQAQPADALVEALEDILSGWIYIRQQHGDLYGVGWDRAQGKAEEALATYRAAKEKKV